MCIIFGRNVLYISLFIMLLPILPTTNATAQTFLQPLRWLFGGNSPPIIDKRYGLRPDGSAISRGSAVHYAVPGQPGPRVHLVTNHGKPLLAVTTLQNTDSESQPIHKPDVTTANSEQVPTQAEISTTTTISPRSNVHIRHDVTTIETTTVDDDNDDDGDDDDTTDNDGGSDMIDFIVGTESLLEKLPDVPVFKPLKPLEQGPKPTVKVPTTTPEVSQDAEEVEEVDTTTAIESTTSLPTTTTSTTTTEVTTIVESEESSSEDPSTEVPSTQTTFQGRQLDLSPSADDLFRAWHGEWSD